MEGAHRHPYLSAVCRLTPCPACRWRWSRPLLCLEREGEALLPVGQRQPFTQGWEPMARIGRHGGGKTDLDRGHPTVGTGDRVALAVRAVSTAKAS